MPLFSCSHFDGFPLCHNAFSWNIRKLTISWICWIPGTSINQESCTARTSVVLRVNTDPAGRDYHRIPQGMDSTEVANASNCLNSPGAKSGEALLSCAKSRPYLGAGMVLSQTFSSLMQLSIQFAPFLSCSGVAPFSCFPLFFACKNQNAVRIRPKWNLY